jgi:hypothetical protein
MVACLSFAVPIWIRNGYSFWIPGREFANRENVSQAPGEKEVCCSVLYKIATTNLEFSGHMHKCNVDLFNLFV